MKIILEIVLRVVFHTFLLRRLFLLHALAPQDCGRVWRCHSPQFCMLLQRLIPNQGNGNQENSVESCCCCFLNELSTLCAQFFSISLDCKLMPHVSRYQSQSQSQSHMYLHLYPHLYLLHCVSVTERECNCCEDRFLLAFHIMCGMFFSFSLFSLFFVCGIFNPFNKYEIIRAVISS